MKAPRHVQCCLCGRHFVGPTPHRCSMGYLVHYRRAARIRGLETIFNQIMNVNGGQMKDKNGTKFDNEKIRLGEVLHNFSRAIIEIGKVGTYGANKYSMDNFGQVSDSVNRYTNAMYRHLFAEANGEKIDSEWGLLHATHAAWNAIARLEMILREEQKKPTLYEKHKLTKKEIKVAALISDENTKKQLEEMAQTVI